MSYGFLTRTYSAALTTVLEIALGGKVLHSLEFSCLYLITMLYYHLVFIWLGICLICLVISFRPVEAVSICFPSFSDSYFNVRRLLSLRKLQGGIDQVTTQPLPRPWPRAEVVWFSRLPEQRVGTQPSGSVSQRSHLKRLLHDF